MEAGSSLAKKLQSRCCIAGGGPAGMMLGYLLARAGIEVLVLEKHADFLRDFRGDTVHPSTLETMHELGLLEEFLKRPHQEISQVRARIGGDDILLGEMSYLRTRCRFMALMPQWDFLDFLAEQGRRYPTFHLRMRAEVTGLIEENGCIVGIRANTPDCLLEARADLVVGADGRNSVVRERAGFAVQDVGASMDALQVRLSKRADDPKLFLYSDRGKNLVTIDRGDYWHCGFAVPKETAEKMQARGIEDFRASIAEVAPFLARSCYRTARLERCEIVDRQGRSAAEVVSARFVVHRRCSPCDVPGRRRRYQSGYSGRGRCSQHTCRAPSQRHGK